MRAARRGPAGTVAALALCAAGLGAPGQPYAGPLGRVTALASGGGRLWVATAGAGLWELDPTAEPAERWRRARGLPSEVVADVALDATGRVWAATDAGAARAAPGAVHFAPVVRGLPIAEVTCVAPLADGRLYAGTARGIVQLVAGDVWRALYETHEFARSRVVACAAGPDGSAWFAKARQLTRVAPDGSFRVVHRDPLEPDRAVPFPSTRAAALTVDGTGRIWLAGEGFLAVAASDLAPRIAVERWAPAPWPSALPVRWVEAVAVETDGTAWLLPADDGTPGVRGWAARRRPKGSSWEHVPLAPAGGPEEGAPPVALAIHRDTAGTTWLGTSAGLWRLDGDAFRPYAPR